MDVYKALERFGSSNPPDPTFARVLPEVREVAEMAQNRAYQFVDVGDKEGRMVEVRCWPGVEKVALTVVDRRGLPLDAPVTHDAPFIRMDVEPVEKRRRWWQRGS